MSCDPTRESHCPGLAGGPRTSPTQPATVPGGPGGCSKTPASSALLPLLGAVALLPAQRLLLALQLFPQLLCLAQVALRGLLLTLLQLGLVQAPEPPHLLLVLGNESLDLWLQTCGDRGCTRDRAARPLPSSHCPKTQQSRINYGETRGQDCTLELRPQECPGDAIRPQWLFQPLVHTATQPLGVPPRGTVRRILEEEDL